MHCHFIRTTAREEIALDFRRLGLENAVSNVLTQARQEATMNEGGTDRGASRVHCAL